MSFPDAAMARSLGVDVGSMGKEAEAVWNKLNDLAANDPAGYQDFLREQMEEIQGDAVPGSRARSAKRTFTATAGFTVKTAIQNPQGLKVTSLEDGARTHGNNVKVFINMTSHEAISPPIDKLGHAVNERENVLSAHGLQIPLVVGPLRDTHDHRGDHSLAVDVVFHPWVIDNCYMHGKGGLGFQAQVVELALKWVEDEHRSVKLARNWKLLQNAKYKGGGGEKGAEVVPFPVEDAVQQEQPNDARAPKHGSSSSNGNSNGCMMESIDGPQGLLDAVKRGRCSPHDDQGVQIELPMPGTARNGENCGSSSSSSSKPLISEVNRKPAVSKGFLHGTKAKAAAPLYPEGSKNGEAPGTYARFMDKCKVVDMSTMSTEEQEKTMQQHAAGGGAPPPAAAAAAAAAQRPQPVQKAAGSPASGFKGVESGFLRKGGNAGKLYGEEGSKEGGPSSGAKTTKDLRFEELMREADPEMAAARQERYDMADPLEGALGELAQALSFIPRDTDTLGATRSSSYTSGRSAGDKEESGNVALGAKMFGGLREEPKKEVERLPASVPPVPLAGHECGNASDSRQNNKGGEPGDNGGQSSGNGGCDGEGKVSSVETAPPYQLQEREEADGLRSAVVKVELQRVANISEVTLDVSAECLKLLVPGHYRLVVKLPFRADTEAAGAKFSKKSRELKVVLQEKQRLT